MSAEAAKERLVEKMVSAKWDAGRDVPIGTRGHDYVEAHAVLAALLAHGDDLNLARGGEREVTRVCNNDGAGGISRRPDGTTHSYHRPPTYSERVSWVFPVSQEQST